MIKHLLTELKTKVKVSSGNIREDELLYMINLIARSELELKNNGNGCSEEIEKEIIKLLGIHPEFKIKKIQ